MEITFSSHSKTINLFGATVKFKHGLIVIQSVHTADLCRLRLRHSKIEAAKEEQSHNSRAAL